MADETTSTAPGGPADTLEILEEDSTGTAGFRTLLANILERAPLLVFGVFSIVALVVIVGVFLLFRSVGTPPPAKLDPGAVIAARDLQLQAARTSTALSVETAFEQALHPMLSLAEIRQAEVPTGFLAEEMLRLKQVNLALGVDVRQTLRQSRNRTVTFDTMLEHLVGIDRQLAVAAGRIVDQEQVLRERIATAAAQEKAATAQLNASVESTDPGISAQALGTVVSARERHAQLSSRLSLLEDVRDEIPSSSLALRARIAGMRANRELLIRDLTAIDIDRAGIEIIRAGETETYYNPALDVQLSGAKNSRSTAPGNAYVALPSPTIQNGGSGATATGSASVAAPSPTVRNGGTGLGQGLNAMGQPMFGAIPMVTMERGSDGLPKLVLHDQ